MTQAGIGFTGWQVLAMATNIKGPLEAKPGINNHKE